MPTAKANATRTNNNFFMIASFSNRYSRHWRTFVVAARPSPQSRSQRQAKRHRYKNYELIVALSFSSCHYYSRLDCSG
jgi:hypothetical protein